MYLYSHRRDEIHRHSRTAHMRALLVVQSLCPNAQDLRKSDHIQSKHILDFKEAPPSLLQMYGIAASSPSHSTYQHQGLSFLHEER